MTILEFIEEYGKDIRPAEEIFRQWALEEKIDDPALMSPITANINVE